MGAWVCPGTGKRRSGHGQDGESEPEAPSAERGRIYQSGEWKQGQSGGMEWEKGANQARIRGEPGAN